LMRANKQCLFEPAFAREAKPRKLSGQDFPKMAYKSLV
jgi:hypothetical protein